MADTTIRLEVTNTQPNDQFHPSNWKRANNSSGTPINFWYQFTEGNNSNIPGGFKFNHGDGAKHIDIQLKNSGNYTITGVGIIYDDDNSPKELYVDDSQKSAQKWTLHDDDITAESGYFNVTLSFMPDHGAEVTGIICDPRWEVD